MNLAPISTLPPIIFLLWDSSETCKDLPLVQVISEYESKCLLFIYKAPLCQHLSYPENTFRTQTLFKEQMKKQQYISKENVLSFFSLNTELLNNKDCYCSENSGNIFIRVKEVPHNPPNPPSHTIISAKSCISYHARHRILQGGSRMISSCQHVALHANI